MEISEENLTYTDAIRELELILQELEDATINVDELSQKVKRAGELLVFCKNKLTSTEHEVNNLLKNFDKDQKS